jgi:hypothetical protein
MWFRARTTASICATSSRCCVARRRRTRRTIEQRCSISFARVSSMPVARPPMEPRRNRLSIACAEPSTTVIGSSSSCGRAGVKSVSASPHAVTPPAQGAPARAGAGRAVPSMRPEVRVAVRDPMLAEVMSRCGLAMRQTAPPVVWLAWRFSELTSHARSIASGRRVRDGARAPGGLSTWTSRAGMPTCVPSLVSICATRSSWWEEHSILARNVSRASSSARMPPSRMCAGIRCHHGDFDWAGLDIFAWLRRHYGVTLIDPAMRRPCGVAGIAWRRSKASARSFRMTTLWPLRSPSGGAPCPRSWCCRISLRISSRDQQAGAGWTCRL